MSGLVTGWVLKHGPHPKHVDRNGKPYGQRARGYRAVLIPIADAANADGTHAHPGTNNVAEGALYSRRQTMTIISELVAEGWLKVEEEGGGRGRATQFAVLMERVQPPRSDDGERVQSEPVKGAVSEGNSAAQTAPQRPTNVENNETLFVEPPGPDPVAIVWETWKTSTGHHRAVLDEKRRKKIRKALDAFSLDDVTAAVQGWAHSPWHRGENPNETVYDGIETLLRDAAQIEKMRDLYLDHLSRIATARHARVEEVAGPAPGSVCATCEGRTWVYDEATGNAAPCPDCRAGIIP